jgi:two-component system NtrC family sensor kinase
VDAYVRKEDSTDVLLARLAAVLRNSAETRTGETSTLLGPKKILVVDDSQVYLHELSAALSLEGFVVAMARSGEEALEVLAVQSVDCILLDMVMPGWDGCETCRRIKWPRLFSTFP